MRDDPRLQLNNPALSTGVRLTEVLPFLVGLDGTGRLSSVQDDLPPLEVFLDRGRVVDATWGRLRALSALEMGAVFVPHARFLFSAGVQSQTRSFDLGPMDVAARLNQVAREGVALARWIPGPEAVPTRLEAPRQKPVRDREALRLLDQIDGQRSVAELVGARQPLVVLRGLASLVEHGLVGFEPSPEAAPSSEPTPPNSAASVPAGARAPSPAEGRSPSAAAPLPSAAAASPSADGQPPPEMARPLVPMPRADVVSAGAAAAASPAASDRGLASRAPAEVPNDAAALDGQPPAASEPQRGRLGAMPRRRPIALVVVAAVLVVFAVAVTDRFQTLTPETPSPAAGGPVATPASAPAQPPPAPTQAQVPTPAPTLAPQATTAPAVAQPAPPLPTVLPLETTLPTSAQPTVAPATALQAAAPRATTAPVVAQPATAPPTVAPQVTTAPATVAPQAAPAVAQPATAGPQATAALAVAQPATVAPQATTGLAVAQPANVAPQATVAPAVAQPATAGPQATVAPAVAQPATVAPQATAVVSTDPRTLLDEGFTTAAPGWPNEPTSSAWWDSLGYHLEPRAAGQHVAIVAPGAAALGDVAVTGLFHKSGGPAGGGYGLILRARDGSLNGTSQGGRYYVFEVGDRGEVGAWRREEDRWVDLLPWTHSEAVLPGGASNRLDVRATGSQFAFSVNDTPVAQLTDDSLPTGAVGVFAGGDGNQVVLERFTVAAP